MTHYQDTLSRQIYYAFQVLAAPKHKICHLDGDHIGDRLFRIISNYFRNLQKMRNIETRRNTQKPKSNLIKKKVHVSILN